MNQTERGGMSLPLVEEFYSIQGEGYHTGKAAYFIRVGGCDICCAWCDSKDSWDQALYPLVETDKIIGNIIACPAKSVVVTGGEPLLYDMDYLCSELKKHNITTFLETSGSEKLSGEWDWICLSPKKTSPPLEAIFKLANELKVVITKEADLVWAEENALKVGKDCCLFLQPEWSVRMQTFPIITDYILKHPEWKISVQTHKYIGIP